ncbi:MAG: DUF2283 domain-containing protein [Candidatus Woesearchaeota archaeon]
MKPNKNIEKRFKFDYDIENDILFIYNPKLKSNESFEINNFIVDFSKNKEISAIEILNASSFFSNQENTITNINDCFVRILRKNSLIYIKITFFVENEKKLNNLIIPLNQNLAEI